MKYRYRAAREAHFKFLNENSDAIVLLSDKYKTFRNLQTPKVTSIANAVEYIAAPWMYIKKKKWIIYVGRLERLEKAPQELIKAFAIVQRKHPDWKLVIVGDGPDKDYMVSLASELKVNNIMFTGFTDPMPYFKESAIHCLTSRNEGFGMTLIEGMAYKSVPVAYNSFPVASENIDNGVTGLLAKAQNHVDLAKKLNYLIEHPQRRCEMAQAAYDKVRNCYHINIIARKWYDLFAKLLANRPKRQN